MPILASAFLSSFVLLNAPEATAASDGAKAEGPAAPTKTRAKEWQLQIAPGGEFFIFPGFGTIANGPAFKLAAHRLGWYGNFMVGGGPSLQYSYLLESKQPPDKLHQFTLNGDFVIGGGRYEKFSIYGHLMLGAGILSGYDADTKTKLRLLPTGRALAGVGGFGYITPKISIGALVDFGFPGIVDAFITLGFHLGKK